MRLFLLLTVTVFAYTVSAAERLTPAGTALTPLILDNISSATIAKDIDLGGDEVNASYVVASVPGLGLFQRTASGSFTPWDGRLESLQDNRFNTRGNVLHYAIYSGPLNGVPLPLTIYIGYRDQTGALKYGHFNVQTGNTPPIAEGMSVQTDLSIPYLTLNLPASDPDNDTLSFELLSPEQGKGYRDAFIDSQGRLHVALTEENLTIELSYRVSDGMNFSDPATVRIVTVANLPEKGLGRKDPDPKTYGAYPLADVYGDVLGSPTGAPTLPRSVDLSDNFPIPGDQGPNGSCVGWATAYAAKSYQEKVEMKWDLNRADHLFSPAYIYNQIRVGNCPDGSLISDALKLMVNKGAATLDVAPYDPDDCFSQPSQQAHQVAARFKAREWRRLDDLNAIKSALANRQPVITGIDVYPQLFNLKGPDSIYNSAAGQRQGGHAVTIVGYNDDRAGGAFRIINSWGTKWGDGGYFWMPYQFALQQGIMKEAYTIYDADNTDVPPPSPPSPTPGDKLPNLQPLSWNFDYDPIPGGTGTLTWEVGNTGTAVAPAGAYVNLMLSTDQEISPNDIYVVYEQIPRDLQPGESIRRDASAPLHFRIPDNIPPGVYYVALWVDDLDTVRESNEQDNVSLGNGQVTITNTAADLSVNAWYTEWDVFGNAVLYYEIVNKGGGTAPAGWDIALMLSSDMVIGNGDDSLLYQATDGPEMPPGTVLSNPDQPLVYSVANAPPGIYWMALVVDPFGVVPESNERNNVSLSGNPASFGFSALGQSREPSPAPGTKPANHAYNGKSLETVLQWRKIEISKTPDGKLKVTPLPAGEPVVTGRRKQRAQRHGERHQKTLHGRNGGIFPIVHRYSIVTEEAP